jgi:hypothetical protein
MYAFSNERDVFSFSLKFLSDENALKLIMIKVMLSLKLVHMERMLADIGALAPVGGPRQEAASETTGGGPRFCHRV